MPQSRVDLYWLPLGAGGHLVSRCGRTYERAAAWRDHRPPQPLFHSALDVTVDGEHHVIEMGPVWNERTATRGVVLEGPVGSRVLGRLRAFRYEVRSWPGGRIPDVAWAVGGPRCLSEDRATATALLAHVAQVPALTWGRDELGAGEMWNSNSLVSFLIGTAGLDAAHLCPPAGGRAPGWDAGLLLHRSGRGTVDGGIDDLAPCTSGASGRRLVP